MTAGTIQEAQGRDRGKILAAWGWLKESTVTDLNGPRKICPFLNSTDSEI